MFGINKNGTKHKLGIIMPAFFPASRTTYDGTASGLSATRVQGAIDELAKPTFTEAETRTNIASGESIKTILGKIKKFFTDLKTVAFTGAYSDLNGTENVAVKNATNYFRATQVIDRQDGTTVTYGVSQLNLGNTTPRGTDGNSEGQIAIYGAGTNVTILRAPNSTAYRDIKLPDASGTIALNDANNNFTENQTIDKKNGTTSTVANSMFTVGNNIPQGTDKNSRGIIGIYSNTSKITILWAATDLSSDINVYLPSKGGTLALYDDDVLASVTADGVKTYSQLFNELFAALNVYKISSKGILYGTSLGLMPVCGKSPTGCSFGSVVPVNNSAADTRAVRIMASDSFYISTRTMTSGTSFTDRSNIVPSSGEVFMVCK